MGSDYLSYILIVAIGVSVTIGVFTKLIFGLNIDSDWFWFLTGIGLVFQGFISLKKQRKFDRKFKIIER